MIDLNFFKNKLEENKERLETQLSEMGQRNPANPEDWEAMPTEAGQNIRITEATEMADTFEEFQNRSAVQAHLEEMLNSVKTALAKIKKGDYGKCEACGNEIEKERLMANPSAPTCVKHSKG